MIKIPAALVKSPRPVMQSLSAKPAFCGISRINESKPLSQSSIPINGRAARRIIAARVIIINAIMITAAPYIIAGEAKAAEM